MSGVIAVIDYGIGNLRSAEKALVHLGADACLSADPDVIAGASGVVLPGVGAFGACMDALSRCGLEEVTTAAARDGRPFLGICIGMQMLFEGSDEAPNRKGLGVLPGRVVRLPFDVRLPQMGWNTIEAREGSRLLAGLPDPAWFYFVHSYAPEPTEERAIAGWCEYGTRFVAAIETDSVWATQFHPEKSGDNGLTVLSNFVEACG